MCKLDGNFKNINLNAFTAQPGWACFTRYVIARNTLILLRLKKFVSDDNRLHLKTDKNASIYNAAIGAILLMFCIARVKYPRFFQFTNL